MLTLTSLSKAFPRPDGSLNLLFGDFSAEVKPGTIVAVMGPNGCGKSTLLNVICGTVQQDGGSVHLDGRSLDCLSVHARARFIGRVHQDSYRSLASELCVGDILAISARRRNSLSLGTPNASTAIKELGRSSPPAGDFLQRHSRMPARELSGGQRQFLAIASALLGQPQILLLDEHNASLDQEFRSLSDALVRNATQLHHVAVLCVTHDMQWARGFAHEFACFQGNGIAISKTVEA